MNVIRPLRAAIVSRSKAALNGAEGVGAPRVAAIRWRPIILQAFVIWLVTRLAYAALTYYAVIFSSGSRVLTGVSVPARVLLHSWQHWDANWYVSIALYGYDGPQPTAFFPLYPALIHLVTGLVGVNHALLAAMLISNLGTLGAFIGIALLAANEAGREDAAWRGLRAFIAYPLAFFLTAPYTEGLFVAFVTGALLCARRGSWRWAALWGLLAGFTRPTAVALILPLLWEYGRQHGWWRRESWQSAGWRALIRPKALAGGALAIGAVPIAIGAYMTYCWIRFGDPIMFFRAERIYWNHSKVPPWTAIGLGVTNFLHAPMLSDAQAQSLTDIAPLAIFAVLAVIGIRRLPLMLTLYTFGILYLSIASPVPANADILTSCGRYLIAAVPVFLLLGKWMDGRPWLDMLIVSLGFLVQAILTLVYLRNGLVR